MMQEKRRVEKIQMRKQIKALEERNVRTADDSLPSDPKRSEKAARFSVPLPKARGISEEEMFKIVTTGKKTHQKSWKRIITKPTFVGEGFTRQNPKAERFIRPMGLRQKFAHVSHPTLGVKVKAPILSVKKNPQDHMYTRLGVLKRGTVVEVNVSDLGLTTTTGKCVWGRYAQITNNPEDEGTVNA
ncbi:Nop seven-associated 2 domain protein [Colletotrichum camelliae]|nr:Nop seven-associated 2 domain protein [Colletotrichum camelliae]